MPTYSDLSAQLRAAITAYVAEATPAGKQAILDLERALRELDESVMQPHYFPEEA